VGNHQGDLPVCDDRERHLAADELARQFWTLGNLITGFYALQVLGFLAVTYTTTAEIHNRILKTSPFLILGIAALGSAVFFAAVWYCGSKEVALRRAAGHPLIVISSSKHTTVGRIICIAAWYGLIVLRMQNHLVCCQGGEPLSDITQQHSFNDGRGVR